MLDDVAGVDTAAVIAIIFSISAGLNSVLTRTINARLSEHVGAMPGSFINHLVGLPFTLALAVFIPSNNISLLAQSPSPQAWIYFGGLLGVIVIYVMNVAVPKISSFRMTLLAFIGQVFIGIILDLIRDSGLIVAAGVGINMLIEYIQNLRNGQRKKIE
jgi:transporter family-2 protein